jgi:hypothetical protein
MNKIQYVSKYISLSQEGLVPKIECPMDQGLLLCNLSEQDDVFLYCLSCDYNSILGLSTVNKIKKEVEKAIEISK